MLLPDEVLFRLAREVGTPLTIYDEADIRRRAQALRSAFAWNGGFHNFFPVSCCANPAILRILCEEGFGLACRTTEELRLAGEAGCAPDMTRYMPIFPSPEELHTCRETGDLVLDDADLILRLERLGELLGIGLEEMMAFGDAENDLDMLGRAGIGVAMGNAAPELQAAADYVTATNDDDGIAKALRHFVLVP